MRARVRLPQVVAALLLVAAACAGATLAGASPSTVHITPVSNQLKTVPSGGGINALSCPTPTTCVAVGNDANREPLTFAGAPGSWNDAHAKQISLGKAFGSAGGLNAVSCTSATSCVAIGYDYKEGMLVLVGNPSTWGPAQARSVRFGPAFDNYALFQSIACTSSTSCVAVGEDGASQPVTLSGNPATWGPSQATVIGLGAPFGSTGYLESVTCSSSTACVAAGSDADAQPIDLVGDPSAWTVADVTAITLGPTFGNGGYLDSLSCTSSTVCTAVGYDSSDHLLLVNGDPTTWTAANASQITLPHADGAGGILDSVACTSLTTCTTVGWDYSGQSLTLTGNPATWSSLQPTRVGTSAGLGVDATLNAVACVTATTCVAAGTDGNQRPFDLAGNPATWAPHPREIALFGAGFGVVESVSTLSCATKTYCLAIIENLEFQPVLVEGNPAAWGSARTRLLKLPKSLGSGGSFGSVTCMKPTSCVAVGRDDKGEPILLHGNPAGWSASQVRQLSLPASMDKGGVLTSVACTGPTQCVAVGFDNKDEPIVLDGNPVAWSAAKVKQLTLGTSLGRYGYLTSVACTSATSCVVVGDDGKLEPVVLVGNPASWKPSDVRQLKLGASFDKEGSFQSVTCTSATSCVAVGRDGAFEPIAVDGSPATWAPKDIRTMTIATRNGTVGGFSTTLKSGVGSLQDISCASSTTCVAIGYDEDGSPIFVLGSTTTLTHGPAGRPVATAGFYDASFDAISCVGATCYVTGVSRTSTSGSRSTYIARI